MDPTHPEIVPPVPREDDGNISNIDAGENKGTQKFNLSQVIHNYQGMNKDELRQVVEDLLPEILMERFTSLGIGEGAPLPNNVPTEDRGKIDEVLNASYAIEELGVEFDPWDYITLANAAKLRHRIFTAKDYAEQALEKFRENDDRRGEAMSLFLLAEVEYHMTPRELDEAESL